VIFTGRELMYAVYAVERSTFAKSASVLVDF